LPITLAPQTVQILLVHTIDALSGTVITVLCELRSMLGGTTLVAASPKGGVYHIIEEC
jgi:hypothetical protein